MSALLLKADSSDFTLVGDDRARVRRAAQAPTGGGRVAFGRQLSLAPYVASMIRLRQLYTQPYTARVATAENSSGRALYRPRWKSAGSAIYFKNSGAGLLPAKFAGWAQRVKQPQRFRSGKCPAGPL